MPTNPKGNIEKLERIETAWRTLAPDKSFGGMTFEEFTELVKQSHQIRQTIDNLENQLREAQSERDEKDELALSKAQLVVNGVLADPTEGADSTLYEAMGYVRKSERKSGLTRKKKNSTS